MGGGHEAAGIYRSCRRQALPTIGYLSSGSRTSHPTESFHKGLNEAGYVEGGNVLIEYRFAEGQYDKLPRMAADLAQRQVSVIAAVGGTVSALAAKRATATIPVVFEAGGDPVLAGLVSNINRPGANVTGVNLFASALGAKRLELLTEIVPSENTLAMLINPDNPNSVADVGDAQTAAHSLNRALVTINAHNEMELEKAFAQMDALKAGALMVMIDPFFVSQRARLATLAERYKVPACYGLREFVAAGGLISYGTSISDVFRQVGDYVAQVLKGAKPTDLPVLQPTKFELVINVKASKSLGLVIPPILLARADEAIE